MTKPWNNAVIKQEVEALRALTDDLEEPFQRAVDIVAGAKGRVICTGIGKSGHVAQKIAATLSSTGSPAFFLHPTEAAHGALGVMTSEDVLFAFSRSGRASELKDLFKHANDAGVPIVLISENDRDSLAAISDVVLKMPSMRASWGHAPTTSSVVQMALGDAVAVTVAERKGILEDQQVIALGAKQPFTL